MAANTVSTYDDIADEVITLFGLDTTTTRAQAKRMINNRYARLLAMEDWTFRYAADDAVTVTASSRTVTGLATDFQALLGLWNQDGAALVYLAPSVFYDVYQGDTSTGDPGHYTIVNGTIYVAPTPGTTSSTWKALYRQKITLLSADADEPIVPAEHRYVLVHGALAEIRQLYQDPAWVDAESMWQAQIEDMRRDYLIDVEGEPAMWAADRTWG